MGVTVYLKPGVDVREARRLSVSVSIGERRVGWGRDAVYRFVDFSAVYSVNTGMDSVLVCFPCLKWVRVTLTRYGLPARVVQG